MSVTKDVVSAADDLLLTETDYAISSIETLDMYGESASFTGLLTLAGCPLMVTHENLMTPSLYPTESGVLASSLARLLRAIVGSSCRLGQDITSVLGGIFRHGLLETFLETETDTYTLTAGLLIYIEEYEADFPLDAYIVDDVCKNLNAWLDPETPLLSLPGIDEVVDMLFGSGWMLLARPAPGNVNDDPLVGDVVLQQRPPFLPGLCPAQSTQMSVPLPELGVAP